MLTRALSPIVNTLDEPPTYFLGLPTHVRATAATTGGAFGIVESVLPPGFASPYHTHHREDEAFYVIEGTLAVVIGDTWTLAKPGTYMFGPREIPHGFTAVGDTSVRMLLLCSPAGFEQFVADLSEPAPAPPDMSKLMAVAARYAIDILGPLPELPAELRSQAAANTGK